MDSVRDSMDVELQFTNAGCFKKGQLPIADVLAHQKRRSTAAEREAIIGQDRIPTPSDCVHPVIVCSLCSV